ncbi:hypothetical protein [Vibrio phage phiKT1028]|nr:hypothetical protein [Vibrio phage phiKT1028]
MDNPDYTPEEMQRALQALSGEESLFSDIKAALGFETSKVEQVEGLTNGKLVSQFALGANTVGRLTAKALGYNAGVISTLLTRAKSVDTHEVKCSGKLIGDLTAQGDLDHLLSDQKTLSETITMVMKYQSELESYGKEIQTLMKGAASAKDNAKMTEYSTRLGGVTVPVLKLSNKEGEGYESDTLPMGKTISSKPTNNAVTYQLNGNAGSVSEAEHQFDSAELSKFLNQLKWVNTQQKALSEMINRYAKFVKEWGSTVKDLQGHLDKTEGISKSVENALVTHMSLNSSQIEFYTTFLPRLIAYLNHYVTQGCDLATVVTK